MTKPKPKPTPVRNQTDVLRIIVASEILRNITERDPRTLQPGWQRLVLKGLAVALERPDSYWDKVEFRTLSIKKVLQQFYDEALVYEAEVQLFQRRTPIEKIYSHEA